MHHFRLAFLALTVTILCGCVSETNVSKQDANEDSSAWKITVLRADHGHDTMESEDGGMYHNYFCAVVLTRNDESIHLLYENRLPENLVLKIGDRYHINGLANATYSDDWNGYWIHDVQLQRADAQ